MKKLRTKKKKQITPGDVILVANTDYLPILLQVIRHARKSVDIIAYSFAISATGRGGATSQIVEELIELKKRFKDVEVRLYLEDSYCTSRSGFSSMRQRALSMITTKKL